MRILGLAVLAATAFLSLMPQPWKGRMATWGMFHDFTHVAAFLTACFLITWPLRSGSIAVRIGLLLLSFGALLEFLQTRVYGNRFEYRDVVADAAGVAIGLLLRNLREDWYGR